MNESHQDTDPSDEETPGSFSAVLRAFGDFSHELAFCLFWAAVLVLCVIGIIALSGVIISIIGG